MSDTACRSTYYETKQWPCKAEALRAHDETVGLRVEERGVVALNATPPYLMRQFYAAGRVRFVALLRSPIDRLRHAFYTHVHYPKRYGRSADGLHSYVEQQAAGWDACVAKYGRWRCAIHFEQLGKEQSDVFFHCDQLIRGIYSPFVRDWLAAFPRSLLILRAEDFYGAAATREELLLRTWAHLGLPAPSAGGGSPPYVGSKVEKRLREQPYASWTANKGPIHPKTSERLGRVFAPFNRELRDMLEADGTSCSSSDDCDRFLWAGSGVP